MGTILITATIVDEDRNKVYKCKQYVSQYAINNLSTEFKKIQFVAYHLASAFHYANKLRKRDND